MANTALVWVRDDFRIQNNDALTYATNQHDAVTAVFIFNSNIFDHKREAQKWWVSTVSYTHLTLPTILRV